MGRTKSASNTGVRSIHPKKKLQNSFLTWLLRSNMGCQVYARRPSPPRFGSIEQHWKYWRPHLCARML